MKKAVLISLLAIVAQLFPFSETAVGTTRVEKISAPAKRAQTKVPKGTTVRNNRATLKRGYKFVRVNNNTVQVQKMSNNVITGAFSCNCTRSGKCSLSIGPGEIACVSKTCNGQCGMTVTIDEYIRQ